MSGASIEVLDALESDLQAARAHAQSTHDATLAQLDAARRALDALLRDEAAATAQYVDATQLQMRALRDAVAREMDQARRDVDGFLQDATRRAHEARDRARDNAYRQKQQRLVETQRAACETELVVSRGENLTESPEPSQGLSWALMDWTWVFLPLVVALLLGVGLWLVNARARRAATERRRRVLYSEQLQSRVATSQDREGPSQETKKKKNASDSPRSPSSFDRRPTLQRRLRPAWSPAASTASTVSPRETPRSVFSTHSAF